MIFCGNFLPERRSLQMRKADGAQDSTQRLLSKTCQSLHLAVLTPNALWILDDCARVMVPFTFPFRCHVFGARYCQFDRYGIVRHPYASASLQRCFYDVHAYLLHHYEDPTVCGARGYAGCTACWTFVANMFFSVALVGALTPCAS